MTGPGDAASAPAVRLIDLLLRAAVEQAATDVHLDADEDAPRVRFRIDGVLVPRPAPPPWLAARALARIKALARLDLGESLHAQDGQLSFAGPDGPVDVRVSIVPGDRGECAVLRLLARDAGRLDLGALGVPPRARAALVATAEAPDGIIVVAGPTGSGKTTTLHALIGTLDCERRNVVSIEEPVEIRNRRVRQLPVRRRTGLDFAGALRVVLRQDPDVILVGETRDEETARLAVQAALAGHLVLTTVHASSALGAFDRLTQLGADRRLLAETARAVVSQRLLRTRCDRCGGRACFACEGTGLRGRTGIFEVLRPGEGLREALRSGEPLAALQRIARAEGHVPIEEEAARLLRAGVTTEAEVHRVLGDAAPAADEVRR